MEVALTGTGHAGGWGSGSFTNRCKAAARRRKNRKELGNSGWSIGRFGMRSSRIGPFALRGASRGEKGTDWVGVGLGLAACCSDTGLN